MSTSNQPPKPPETDPHQHAPGVSRTLEENAERSRRERNEKEVERKEKGSDDPRKRI